MKYLRILFSAAALLLAASCIENDLPYPTIELNIRSIEGEGFTVAGISLVNRTVTLTLDEKTDIRKVTIDKAEFDVATSNPMMTDKEKFISQIRTSTCGRRSTSRSRSTRTTSGRSWPSSPSRGHSPSPGRSDRH